MKVKDIDLEHVKTILSALPDGVDVDSINFIGKKVKVCFSAGDDELSNEEYENSLQILSDLINNTKIRENKNYLLIEKEGAKA